MKIFIVIIPQDYQSANAVLFRTETEARQYIANEVDETYRHYTTVQEAEL